jgi:nitroreductase
MDMNILDAVTKRKSIRKYEDKAVPEDIVIKIVEAGRRAPSACSMQTYSIIWVKDEKKRKKLWESCGKQSWILEAPITLALCSDVRKITKMMEVIDFKSSLEEVMGLRWKLFSIVDMALVAQNMVIASEYFGLGSIFIGGALANRRIIEALNLPKGVLPISLLCIGYPLEDPPLRPRIPLENVLFIDEYRDLTNKKLEDSMQSMIEILSEEQYYYKYGMGNKKYTWIDSTKSKLIPNIKTEKALVNILRYAGFTIDESIS